MLVYQRVSGIQIRRSVGRPPGRLPSNRRSSSPRTPHGAGLDQNLPWSSWARGPRGPPTMAQQNHGARRSSRGPAPARSRGPRGHRPGRGSMLRCDSRLAPHQHRATSPPRGNPRRDRLAAGTSPQAPSVPRAAPRRRPPLPRARRRTRRPLGPGVPRSRAHPPRCASPARTCGHPGSRHFWLAPPLVGGPRLCAPACNSQHVAGRGVAGSGSNHRHRAHFGSRAGLGWPSSPQPLAAALAVSPVSPAPAPQSRGGGLSPPWEGMVGLYWKKIHMTMDWCFPSPNPGELALRSARCTRRPRRMVGNGRFSGSDAASGRHGLKCWDFMGFFKVICFIFLMENPPFGESIVNIVFYFLGTP